MMENLKKERVQLRRLFTRAANEVEQKLAADPVMKDDVITIFKIFEDKAERLFKLEESLKELWFDKSDEFDEQDYEKEFDAAETYRDRWITIKSRYECAFNLSELTLNENDGRSSSNGSSRSRKRHFKLPKLELKRFDGDIRNWLGFWGQFKKIDDDEHIDEEDKFQYLVQATEPRSSARELVESFPPSGVNYKRAVEQLKARFARDELLIEIYVRELLHLVLIQATKRESLSLTLLYDKLETQLRALESLGVTSEKYASMLYPLVESALPEDTLKAWERSRTVSRVEAADQTNYLAKLLEFLRLEVESEERLQLARSSFSNSYSLTASRPENPKPAENRLPTAACIFSGEVKKPDKSCIWCGKISHSSTDCFTGRKLSLPDRKDLLKKKGACFTCLKIGHTTKKCKCFVKCLVCSKRHYTIMCPDLPSASVRSGPVSDQNERTEVLIAHRSGPTLLQTVLVKILHNGEAKIVRALFDSRAQRSYVRKDIVARLEIKPSGQEMLSHSLFGGVEVKQKLHKVYELTLQGLHTIFQCNIPFLDEASICGYVPRIETQDLYPILKERNIILTDVGEGAPDVGILIGADVLGSLLTGTIVHVKRNLVAIETKLGWTLQGPMTDAHNSLSSLTSLCNLDLSDLWNLETIGIKDPAEAVTQKNLEAGIIDFFRQTIRINKENRYEVSLPWKEGHPELLDNKELAKKRLFATTKRLLNTGQFKDYDQIFKEWLDLGIIESVPEDNGSGHYLPHRAVVKDSSLTTRIRPVFDASAKDANGNSLNACVEKGPNFVELIPRLLTQFRKHAIGVISDIKKAFLQISLTASDRDFLKFLWWKDEHREDVVTLRHCRVVFGVSSSPFLLGATLTYHLDRATEELHQTAAQLKHSFYVDNCVTSVETEAEAGRFIKESTKLMSQAQFELRGWVAAPTSTLKFEQDEVPVLGLSWDIKRDELFCNAKNITVNEGPITKRVLLSVAQRIFDPIGFTCPTSLVPKLVLQRKN